MTTNSSPQLWLYDTTLRDGTQREGLSVSIEDKLRIAKRLDQLGIPFIEGGWPGANPKDVQFFWQLQEDPLKQAEIVAFCSTRRPNTTAATEPMLQDILAAGTRWVTIFGKSWDLHVTASLKTTLEENLAMIRDTIEYLRSQGRRIIYDAEHWFDGYKHNPDYALQTLEAAIASGAEWLVLCDTNGGTLPHEISLIVQDVNSHLSFVICQEPMTKDIDAPAATRRVGQRTIPQIGIHTHNDSEMAVANAIAAVMAGAKMVQGTINGYGERCGNANLCSLIPNLQLKLGYSCITEDQLTQLTEASRFVSEVVNLAPDEHAPFVGLSAFAHKGGIHVSAVERNPLTYEHIQPEQVGNHRRIVISEQSGLSNVLAKARSFGIDLEKLKAEAKQILQRLKDLESEGFQFEAAEASFALLM
ncbi:MAG: citramalate synthase, partial [Pyrinomonadaceae bacterium]|nr:citramalate synthase [Pyrinomonadaceae bacterium]